MRFLRALLGSSLLTALACAGRPIETKLHSSADETGYALRYPDALEAARQTYAEHKQRAHSLSGELHAQLAAIKIADAELALRVIDEADAAGSSETYVRTRGEDGAFSVFWGEERGPLAARAAAAVQKELADGGCRDRDLTPVLQRAMRDGLDKPLERRLRTSNEAQRTLELHKARLAPGTLPNWQRAADDIALSSYYARVALPEDVRVLQRLLDEQRAVTSTLERALDEERTFQTQPRGGEQKASQERVLQVEKVRAALDPAVKQARAEVQEYEAQLAQAEDEHEQALGALREPLRNAAAGPTASADAEPANVANPTARAAKR